MAAAAAEWDSRSEASPAGDWPPAAAASPVKGKAALPESDAGASVSGSSEAKVDDGNIQEAESSLREGLSLNYEEARALLGRLEYQRGNVEAAHEYLMELTFKLLFSASNHLFLKTTLGLNNKLRSGSSNSGSQHAASLVLEAIYLKSMSLQKLGKAMEAAKQCKSVLDAVEKLWKQVGAYQEALASYRRALLSQWNLDDECCTRIQKRFAVFLLYGGVEVAPPSLASQTEGSFVPRNNLEEAILLLMILLKKWFLGKTHWDPSVMEHLTFALSLCGQTSILAKHLEEVLPGIYPRTERWYSLALCYFAASHNEAALNLLRKSLNKNESPNDIMALLLAAKICSSSYLLSSEGVEYAKRAVKDAESSDGHLKSVALHVLGSCLSKKSKVASSDHQRSLLQTEALKSLNEAISLDHHNPELIFDMGIEYAEQRNMHAALKCAKEFIDATGGSVSKGWRLLSLVLSAQQRYSEAEVVTDAALDETAKWEQGPLLRIRAKLKVAQSLPMEAVEAYRTLLALVQAQRKAYGSAKNGTEDDEDKVSEFEVWQGLANLYSSLSYWRDAEICLQKAKALKTYSATTLHAEGNIHEVHEKTQDALAAYFNALSMEVEHVPSKVSIGALLCKQGPKFLPVARCFLSDALRLEPTNRMAWFYLGEVHKQDGRLADAADCFQAASMLEDSDPVESFRSL
ncbi:unnamed protein product [Miscanthus lutarioriparius]|uniref:Uncharacterized protein n=1 Tax=Miscanthus lutarioriparius TaxID=422564 RepID=A0A811RJ05_9POAL|nr:unnamed protein product [Miscanthus lutarioriparius]